MNPTPSVDEDICPACVAGLPNKILVSFYDPETKRTVGRTVSHEEWTRLKLTRVGNSEN